MPTETMGMEKEMLAGMCIHGNSPAECQSCKDVVDDRELETIKTIGLATRAREVINDKNADQNTIKTLIAIIEERFPNEDDKEEKGLQEDLANKLRTRVEDPSM